MPKQHFLPRFYLEGFTDPDTPPDHEPFVWLIREGQRRWGRRAPENIAAESGFYDITDEEGNVQHGFDEILQEQEDTAARIIRRKVIKQKLLTAEDRERFAIFASLMLGRVPGQLENIGGSLDEAARKMAALQYQAVRSNPASLARWKQRYRQETGRTDMDGLTIEDLDPAKFEISASKAAILQMSFALGLETARFVMQMDWTFLVSQPPNYFVTSDHPFGVADPRLPDEPYVSPGLGSRTVEVTFPITRIIALKASWERRGMRYKSASSEETRTINIRSVQRSKQLLVIAPKTAFPGWDEINTVLRVTPHAG
jgi:hypothetical protein